MKKSPLFFIWIFVQLGLVLAVAYLFKMPDGFETAKFLNLIFFGAITHAVLPGPWRPPFLALLFFGAAWLLFGLYPALFLCAAGFVMFCLCELPIRFSYRLALVLLFGGVLALCRVGRLPWPSSPPVMMALASMFMFRIFLYLYEHRVNPELRAPFWRRLNYFFMLPNICTAFFPIVDYRTYLETYYNEEAAEIYQRGVVRMTLGLSHLLAYRLIRYYLVPIPAEVTDGAGLLALVITAYPLYLMVSGQFHFITGILALFGHNLPLTHRFYFFSSSFADSWRRTNSYWMAFMLKFFYYPALLRLGHWGRVRAYVATIGWVFFMTWLLHGYLWFWLAGHLKLRWMDFVSWELLGAIVAIQAVWSTRKTKRASAPPGLREAFYYGLCVSTVFMVFSLRWSVWKFDTMRDFGTLVAQANLGAADGLRFAGLFVAASVVLAAGRLCWIRLHRPGLGVRIYPALSVVFCLTLIFLAGPSAEKSVDPRFMTVVEKLRGVHAGRGNERYLLPDSSAPRPKLIAVRDGSV